VIEGQTVLRTVPPFVTARFMTIAGKADLSKGCLNPKKKIGGNHAFIRDNKATIILRKL